MLDNLKKSHTFFDGSVVLLRWEQEGNELIVTCFPSLGDGPLYGFGLTEEDVLKDLDKGYAELVDFASGD